MQLVIGNKNYSSWSLRPWLLLDAHQITFEEIPVSLLQEGIADRLGAYSDSARVPVLIDQELVVWDSLAICEYVSEAYLDGKGWPQELALRAQARAVCAEMHAGFNAVRAELPMNCRANRTVDLSGDIQQDIDRLDAIWSNHAQPTSTGAIRLFGQFSIADCFFAPVALRFATYNIQLSEPAAAYAASLLEHPSVQRWVAMALTETETLPVNDAGIELR